MRARSLKVYETATVQVSDKSSFCRSSRIFETSSGNFASAAQVTREHTVVERSRREICLFNPHSINTDHFFGKNPWRRNAATSIFFVGCFSLSFAACSSARPL